MNQEQGGQRAPVQAEPTAASTPAASETEPLAGAFLRLEIAPDDLQHWMAAPTLPCSAWTDWTSLTQAYPLCGPSSPGAAADQGARLTLAEWPAARLALELSFVDRRLERAPNNHAALAQILAQAEAPWHATARYDPASGQLVFGCLSYDDTLSGFLFFLALARSASAHLGERYGLAVLQYPNAPDPNAPDPNTPGARAAEATSLGPDGASRLLAPTDLGAVGGAFAPIITELEDLAAAPDADRSAAWINQFPTWAPRAD
ncbi:MAG: hypothetical protein AAF909_08855 [Pseudomonadota bacterium]